MALAATTVWECRGTTGADANGGGFNPNNVNFATDLAVVSGGTTSAPVVSSASYNWVAGDVNSYVFIKSGTNLFPGWYQVASVASNQATLTATIGAVVLYGGATVLNTVAGCASTSTQAAGGTWSMDYSQQGGPLISLTDMVIGATTTQFTTATQISGANVVGKHIVGNIMNVTAGTNWTVQRVEIVSTSTTTATCDKSLGAAAATGGTGKIGGCFATRSGMIGVTVNSNLCWMKADGTYSETAGVTLGGAFNPSNTVHVSRLTGYTTTRGDNGNVTCQLATNTGLTAFTVSGAWQIKNFIIDCNSLGTSTGLALSANNAELIKVKVLNFTTAGVTISAGTQRLEQVEITSGTSAATAALNHTGGTPIALNLNVHGNSCPGIATIGITISDSLIVANTGASSDGISGNGVIILINNTIDGNGRHGIHGTWTNWDFVTIRNNMITNNGQSGTGYGISADNLCPAQQKNDGNFYYNNATGTRNNMDAVSTIFATDVYIRQYDVTGTADPYTNRAGNDFTLNNNSGGGAAARSVAQPGTLLGATGTGSMDFGVFQGTPPSTVNNRGILTGGRL